MAIPRASRISWVFLTLVAFAATETLGVAPSLLEDPPAPLVPQRPLSARERDRRGALAQFATARSLELQRHYVEALRRYQRAHRLDPQSMEILWAIVPLAMHLHRESVAVRYALLAVDRNRTPDPMLLMRLGTWLREQGQWRQARKLFERTLKLRQGKKTSADVLLLMEVGQLAYLEEDYRRAAECFSRVMHALEHPRQYGLDKQLRKVVLDDRPAMFQIMGESYLRAGQLEAAETAFEKGEAAQANPATMKYNLARVAARRGRSAEAMALLNESYAAGLSGFGMAPYEELAQVLSVLGKNQELIPCLEKLRKNDPENALLGYFLAAKYYEAEKFDRAEALYTALLEQMPTLTGYRNLVAILRRTKNFEGLLRVLGKVIDKTGFLETIGSEAEALATDGEMLRGLIETARKNLPVSPEKRTFGARMAVALLALEGQQWQTAEEFFESAAAADPQRAGKVYLDWGIGLLSSRQSARAVQVFQRAIERKYLPEDTEVLYFYLAGALALENRTDEALAAARRALALKIRPTFEEANVPLPVPATWWGKGLQWLRTQFRGLRPDSVRFFSRVGWVLAYGKRYDEALQTYREVIDKFDPDYHSDRLREELKEVRLEASNVAVLADRMAEAEQWLEQILDEFPGDHGALNDLGYLWAEQNKHLHRALRMTQKAVAAEPENAAYRDSLGWVLFRLGRTEEAIAELEKASAKQTDGVILDHLGDAYKKAGRREEAWSVWRKAAAELRKNHEEDKAEAVEKKMKAPKSNDAMTNDSIPKGTRMSS